jgi:hypothetical protein
MAYHGVSEVLNRRENGRAIGSRHFVEISYYVCIYTGFKLQRRGTQVKECGSCRMLCKYKYLLVSCCGILNRLIKSSGGFSFWFRGSKRLYLCPLRCESHMAVDLMGHCLHLLCSHLHKEEFSLAAWGIYRGDVFHVLRTLK